MCGIFGIRHWGGAPLDLASVRRSTTALRHRGPDDEGYLLADTRNGRASPCAGRDTAPGIEHPALESLAGEFFDLAFGFRRLSILDTSPAGHQPMASADGECWIIFNGEVYNYIELREELSCLGHRFRTGTDTEVVMAAYRQWGADCLKRFVGMWAFAVWDVRRRLLFLARDPFGIKPLYYINDERRLVFASEIKALLDHVEGDRRADPARLYDYLSAGLTDHGGGTLFAQVKQLPPAHSLTVPLDDPRGARVSRYWRIDLDRKLDLSFEDAAARLRELFLDSVRLHLRSDVPVGAALSGGIDSSSIVAAMRALDPELGLHTFSYIADETSVNEERWVDVAGAAAGAEVHKVQPSAAELVADLDRLIRTQDEPFGSTSIYAQHRVFRLARQAGITVMLDGQGADEMLAGYRSYLVARLATLLGRGRWLMANRFLKHASGLAEVRGLALLAGAGGMLVPAHVRSRLLPPPMRKVIRRVAVGAGPSQDWLNRDWFLERGVGPRPPANGRRPDMLQNALHETLVETSLPMLLRYEDRNSMAHSIESRVPFLTTELAEFILSLPEDYLIAADGTSKSVFRRAMRGIVPDPILDRRDKIGFATPEKTWLAALRPWVDEVLRSEAARRVPALNLPAAEREWEGILAGHKPFDFRVWRWLNVIRWTQELGVSY